MVTFEAVKFDFGGRTFGEGMHDLRPGKNVKWVAPTRSMIEKAVEKARECRGICYVNASTENGTLVLASFREYLDNLAVILFNAEKTTPDDASAYHFVVPNTGKDSPKYLTNIWVRYSPGKIIEI